MNVRLQVATGPEMSFTGSSREVSCSSDLLYGGWVWQVRR